MDSGDAATDQAPLLWVSAFRWLLYPSMADVLAACDLPTVCNILADLEACGARCGVHSSPMHVGA